MVKKGPKTKPIEERFWPKVDKSGDCWLWTGGTTRGGYGNFSKHKNDPVSSRRAHRVAYELMIGLIPEGLFLCHKCDVRLCVNPDHMFLGTQQDNVDDMVAKGRNYVHEAKEFCGRGHKDWARRPNGTRYCRICNFAKGERKGRKKETCIRGHNDWRTVSTTGERYCGPCHVERANKANAKRTEARRASKLG